MKISPETRVILDKFLEYNPIPGIASANAYSNLFQKKAYKEGLKTDGSNPKYQDPYHQRIIYKRDCRLYLFLIPGANLPFAVYHLGKIIWTEASRPKKEEAYSQAINYLNDGNAYKALPLLRYAARKGFPAAKLTLGQIYTETHDTVKIFPTKKQRKQGIDFIIKAAETIPEAYIILGICYTKGVDDVILQDRQYARSLFKRADEKITDPAKKKWLKEKIAELDKMP